MKVVKNGVTLATPFMDLTTEVDLNSERGLLSIAFAPDYSTSRKVYAYLAAKDPLGQLQIREYTRSPTDPDRTLPGWRKVWAQAHSESANHNGGTIAFGPDNMLWLATGDGGGSNDTQNRSQRLSTQLGKLIRIDPTPTATRGYTIPPDNPFVGPDDGAHDTIWASGLRNPFRFSFDRRTGDLVIGDVGQGAREEIDYVRRADGLGRGGDFGWRCYEGSIRTPGIPACEPRGPHILPVFEYENPPTAGRAVTGGVVVRDPGLPTLLGRYLYADYAVADVRSLQLGIPSASGDQSTGLAVNHVVAFGTDACARVYIVSIDGPVSRLQDGAPGRCVRLAEPAG